MLLTALSWVASCAENDPARSTGSSVATGTDDKTSDTTATDATDTVRTFEGEAWVDNWFALYAGDRLLAEDSVAIDTERSFNAETFSFALATPTVLSFILKDFKQDDTGLEYIGTARQQIGDGGFIFQLREQGSSRAVLVSQSSWRCRVLHRAPLDPGCVTSADPSRDCAFESTDAPDGWRDEDFDDSGWMPATEHPASAVGPKEGYDTVAWDPSARFVWSADIRLDNTVICRARLAVP